MKMEEKAQAISKVGDVASKEYNIEISLKEMKEEWEDFDMVIDGYKKTGSYIIIQDTKSI